MDRGSRRIARTESAFRAANEGIEKGLWPDQTEDPVRFRCECANPGCNVGIEVPLAEYERVRADSRRFIVATGHEILEVERVVRRATGYTVVEKVGDGGEVAEELDPRP